MSLLVDPSRNRDRDRDRNDKRIRTAQEAKPKDVYYRKEYGWIMSNADVEKEKGVEQQFTARANAIEKRNRQNESSYRSAISKGNSDINSAYDDGIGGMKRPNMDMVSIRIVEGKDDIKGTYQVSREVANQYAASDKLWTSWHGNYLNIDARARGGGNASRQLMKDLPGIEQQVKAAQQGNNQLYDKAVGNANIQRGEQLSGFNVSSEKSYQNAKSIWDAELVDARGAYGKRKATGKQTYADSKKKYNESVMGALNSGLLETPTNQVKTGASNGNQNV